MDRKTYLKILNVQEFAMNDPEYLALHKDYAPAQERFADLLFRLPASEQAIIEDYLQHSTFLFHRLMALALETNLPGSEKP